MKGLVIKGGVLFASRKRRARNYSPQTTRGYIHAVEPSISASLQKSLAPRRIRRYQLYLLNGKKYTAGSVKASDEFSRALRRNASIALNLSYWPRAASSSTSLRGRSITANVALESSANLSRANCAEIVKSRGSPWGASPA